jgi:hypothetical protein
MDIYQHSWIQEESLCYEHKKNDGQQIQNVQNFQQLRNNATVRHRSP